jgi:hypothetical protein
MVRFLANEHITFVRERKLTFVTSCRSSWDAALPQQRLGLNVATSMALRSRVFRDVMLRPGEDGSNDKTD